ncbi:MAG: hypothetical protein NVS2B16_34140 [Chloroflexota bacterium]
MKTVDLDKKLLLTIREAYLLTGISERTLRRKIVTGDLPVVRVDRMLRFVPKDLADLTGKEEEKRRQEAESQEARRRRRGALENALSTESLRCCGSIYFIQACDGGLIKIGTAINVQERFEEIQRMCPIKLRLLGALAGSRPLESFLHAYFVSERHHGEWFDPSQELLALIDEHAKTEVSL